VLRDDVEETVQNVVFSEAPSTTEWDNVYLWVQYGLAWTASRLQWCECILNVDQEWPMFSPNVGRRKYPARARLLFADGTEMTIRQRSDPEDLTWYFRSSPGKDLAYDRFVSAENPNRRYACSGWCRWLTHLNPVNDHGARLKEIRIYQVRYDFPRPDEDAHALFLDLMEKTRDHRTISTHVYTTFFRYWPADREKGTTEEWQFVRAFTTRYGLTELEKQAD
jgi:hypothetical protein